MDWEDKMSCSIKTKKCVWSFAPPPPPPPPTIVLCVGLHPPFLPPWPATCSRRPSYIRPQALTIRLETYHHQPLVVTHHHQTSVLAQQMAPGKSYSCPGLSEALAEINDRALRNSLLLLSMCPTPPHCNWLLLSSCDSSNSSKPCKNLSSKVVVQNSLDF